MQIKYDILEYMQATYPHAAVAVATTHKIEKNVLSHANKCCGTV